MANITIGMKVTGKDNYRISFCESAEAESGKDITIQIDSHDRNDFIHIGLCRADVEKLVYNLVHFLLFPRSD